MSFLYPTCPNCGNKASGDNGVELRDVIVEPFTWQCKECNIIHKGSWHPNFSSVVWESSRKPILDKIKTDLKGLIKR